MGSVRREAHLQAYHLLGKNVATGLAAGRKVWMTETWRQVWMDYGHLMTEGEISAAVASAAEVVDNERDLSRLLPIE